MDTSSKRLPHNELVSIDLKLEQTEKQPKEQAASDTEQTKDDLKREIKDVPLSEIRDIAYHVKPPVVASARITPLSDHLKRTDPFQFGSRYLEESDDVFAWNAWDHVDPSKDDLFISYAASQYAFQREHAASEFDRKRINANPEKFWNNFYSNNEANFFKDRKWLRQEFPVLEAATMTTREEIRTSLAGGALVQAAQGQTEKFLSEVRQISDGPWNVILEVGAGAGNTAFPLVRDNKNPRLMVHACDFSAKAVEVIRESESYNPKHISASQWDLAADNLPPGIEAGTVDIVILIFVFSALAPEQWAQAVQNVWKALRPGGEVCFRDYGRGDLAQVRFKKGRLLGDNFYVRGDGTRVYFFEQDELRNIWSGKVKEVAAKAQDTILGNEAQLSMQRCNENGPQFEILTLGTDRRLLVNRQKQLKMYRCWQQARLRKPEKMIGTA